MVKSCVAMEWWKGGGHMPLKVYLNDSIKSSTCTCIETSYLWQLNTTTNVISCYNPNPEKCTDTMPNDGVCDNEQNIRCSATVLNKSQKTIAKYLLYFVALWIILWCVVTIVVNIMHRNNGHHRYIHLYEELVIILLVIVIGILNTLFASKRTFYLFILAALLALVSGPTIFVVHTFCHLNTCQKWGKPGCFGSFYMLCPEKPKKEKCDDDEDDLTPQEPTPMKEESPPPPLPNKVAPLIEETPPEPTKKYPPVHTEASHFYSWLTALDNNARRSSEVLFRPKIA
ncbi:hypothetical protein Aduo_017091 [Ancylostoma duodenale]